MIFLKKFQQYILLTFLLSVTMSLVGCSDSEADSGGGELQITLTNTKVAATEIAQFAQVVCSRDWRIAFDYPNGETAWCTAPTASGHGNQTVAVSYSRNKADEQRLAIIHLISGRDTASVTLTQLGKDGNGGDVEEPDHNVPGAWLELPAVKSQSNSRFITHYTTVKSKKVRNFSLYFDTHEKIAYWVAYPHCKMYLGSQGRSGEFELDPNFSGNEQMNTTVPGYDRGHQIPSGDRTAAYEMNVQTFYYSNMTPQLGSFNQKIWVDLENKVREWTKACDTLYVVTGAVLKTAGGNETVKYASDKVGNRIAVPNYYFKVLLRLDVSGGNYNYSAIGFWFEHKANSGKVTRSYAMSVDDIERKTGMDFFVNLPQVTQDRVEAENKPEEWGL